MMTLRETQPNHMASSVPMLENNTHGDGKMDNKLIDLNARPQRVHGQTSNNQVFIFQCLGWSLVFYFFAFKH